MNGSQVVGRRRHHLPRSRAAAGEGDTIDSGRAGQGRASFHAGAIDDINRTWR